ncbi:hypothetical protein WIW50_01565 [Flavobacteriaceae bacterium 3-367]|uniref:hypothetical protein n=1 Tax=Eudoraea algarum TaxID=3417568 RepID=UPI0032958E9D
MKLKLPKNKTMLTLLLLLTTAIGGSITILSVYALTNVHDDVIAKEHPDKGVESEETTSQEARS